MQEETARPELLAQRLIEITRLMEAYRSVAPRGRLPLNDLIMWWELEDRHAGFNDGNERAINAFIKLVESDQSSQDRSYLYDDFRDEISDAMEAVGLDPWPEPEAQP